MARWIDRVIAFVAFAALVIFLAVPVLKVSEVDLTIVIVVVVLMAAVDFGLLLFRRNGDGR